MKTVLDFVKKLFNRSNTVNNIAYWDYRVMQKNQSENLEVGFVEVYYDKYDRIISWSEDFISPVWCCHEGFCSVVKQALKKPMLIESEIESKAL